MTASPAPPHHMAEIERLRAALSVAWVRMRNARGAVESNQVIDKDVRGTLTRGIEEIDAVLSHIPTPSPKEAVAWRWRSTLFTEWNLSDKPPVDQATMERETELNMVGLEWEALYASPSPETMEAGQ